MTKMRHILSYLLLAALTLSVASCGSSPLDKAVKRALVQQDTTQAQFDSICGIIQQSPDRYRQYLDDKGQINIAELQALFDRIGGELRPPMRWDISAYGQQELSLTIYFERSGSMVPYDNAGDRGQLKKAVNDIINQFPGRKVSINIVNDNIYPYQGTVDEFIKDRNIYASTAGVGNSASTDFQQIFGAILKAQDATNVSVVVTDLIYSPADAGSVSIDKILNEENSLATSIFRQYKGKSVLVHQLMGDYNGKYYPYTNKPVEYRGMRPFYILVIADTPVMDRMAAQSEYAELLRPSTVRNSYRFNQSEAAVDYCVVPDWKDNAGRFRVDHEDATRLTKCEGDKTTGILCLTMAVRLDGLQKEESFLADARNYKVQSASGFELKVTPITPDLVTGNNKMYLDGKTHLLTLTGKMNGPRDQVTISLPNEMPAWIAQSTSRDDTNPAASGFSTTTLGLKEFLDGIASAFGAGGNYTTLTLNLEH